MNHKPESLISCDIDFNRDGKQFWKFGGYPVSKLGRLGELFYSHLHLTFWNCVNGMKRHDCRHFLPPVTVAAHKPSDEHMRI